MLPDHLMPPSFRYGTAKYRSLHKPCPAHDCDKGFVHPISRPERGMQICPACNGMGMVKKQALELMKVVFGTEWPISLTKDEKLQALANRYYGKINQDWEPKVGDFYTTSRADLELYQIVSIQDGQIGTIYRDPARSPGRDVSYWPASTFLSLTTFGANRVHVPNWIFAS